MKDRSLVKLLAAAAILLSSRTAHSQNVAFSDSSFAYLEPEILSTNLRYDRVLLKHHFLCACIQKNPVTVNAFANDYSLSSYFPQLMNSYSKEGLDKLWAYETRFVQEAAFSGKKPKGDHDSGNAIFFRCMQHYEGEQLEKFVRSLDQYFLFPKK